jgi:hypothetical protein
MAEGSVLDRLDPGGVDCSGTDDFETFTGCEPSGWWPAGILYPETVEFGAGIVFSGKDEGGAMSEGFRPAEAWVPS